MVLKIRDRSALDTFLSVGVNASEETRLYRIGVATHAFADTWAPSEFTMMREKLYWKEDTEMKTTHWYRFQEAVKAHQAVAMADLDKLFAKMGVNLHQA